MKLIQAQRFLSKKQWVFVLGDLKESVDKAVRCFSYAHQNEVLHELEVLGKEIDRDGWNVRVANKMNERERYRT